MRQHRATPLLTGALSAVVLAVVMTVVVVSGIPGGPQLTLPWNQKATLHVQFADADALAPHASVEIAGVKVGEVESVALQGNTAVATLQIAPQYADVHSDATVYLRAHGLFGPKYVYIAPGTSGAPVLQNGATLSAARTVEPVDLDAILQDLQTPEQRALQTFFLQFGEAAAGKGNDVNQLLAATDSLSQVLDTPLKSLGTVAPQLSNMLVNDEAFNNYFAQAPLDQLIANSEVTWKAFADNGSHIESLLINANKALGSLDAALNGEPGNIAGIIQKLGAPGGTIDKLNTFTYMLGLFGANLTGREKGLGSDPADQDVEGGIQGAITNVASTLLYSDPCIYVVQKGDDNHCSVSPDSRQHFLHVLAFNYPPTTLSPNTGYSGPSTNGSMSDFASWLAP